MISVALGYVQYLVLAGSALVAGKLFFSGLFRRYPVFFLYFLFRIPNSIWPLFLDLRSQAYYNLWRVTSVLALVLYVLAIAELYRLVFEWYRGLQTVGRWALYLSIAVS